jgi:transcriptional regulator with XRE-family HTH domain
MEFRDYMKKMLKKKNISVIKLSQEIGVRETYLSDVIAGRRVSLPVVHKISKYLHDPHILVKYVEEYFAKKENEENLKRRYKV